MVKSLTMGAFVGLQVTHPYLPVSQLRSDLVIGSVCSITTRPWSGRLGCGGLACLSSDAPPRFCTHCRSFYTIRQYICEVLIL